MYQTNNRDNQNLTSSKKENQNTTISKTSPFYNRDFEDYITSDYINLKDKQSGVFEFVKGKEKIVEKLDFNKNQVKKAQFIVIDQADPEREERILELSRMHVPNIYNELKKGATVLELYRSGTGKDTRYIVKPIR